MRTLTEILDEVIASDGYGLAIDKASREIKAIIRESLPEAKTEVIPEGEQDPLDPEPDTWRYLPGERERRSEAISKVMIVLNQASRGLGYM